MRRDDEGRDFKVLPGGGERRARVGDVEVIASIEARQPFPVDARVEEEDTWLVLSSEARFLHPEHPVRVMTEASEARPHPPGTVVPQEGKPLRLAAVVHDLDADPTWREEWVAEALGRALRLSEVRGVESLRLPMIGSLHGSLPAERFIELLGEELRSVELATLCRIWLVLPDGTDASILDAINT